MSSRHIVELQSMRGIAATAVMLGHSLVYYDTPQWFDRLATTAGGRAAVVVFFVLSGYVLTRSLSNAQFDADTIVRFYVKRVFRIYPAIWAASALGLIYVFALHWQIPVAHEGEMIRSEFRPDRLDTLHIVASIAGMTTFILPQLWTIFVEIVASIAMPGIAFITLRRPRWFGIMLAVAILVSCTMSNTYYHVTMYFMDFVVGSGLAMPGIPERLFQNVPARLIVTVGLVGLACSQHLPFEDYWSPTAHLVETFLAASIIGTLIGAKQHIASFQSKFLLFLGDISYSVYLLHYVVVCSLAKGFAVLQTSLVGPIGVVPLNVALASVTCLITLPLAWLSFKYIEQPGIELGRRSLRYTSAFLGARRV